jgi:hypothetical protein
MKDDIEIRHTDIYTEIDRQIVPDISGKILSEDI